jgi:hypothetical protein
MAASQMYSATSSFSSARAWAITLATSPGGVAGRFTGEAVGALAESAGL